LWIEKISVNATIAFGNEWLHAFPISHLEVPDQDSIKILSDPPIIDGGSSVTSCCFSLGLDTTNSGGSIQYSGQLIANADGSRSLLMRFFELCPTPTKSQVKKIY
jgi:hypothetical protein